MLRSGAPVSAAPKPSALESGAPEFGTPEFGTPESGSLEAGNRLPAGGSSAWVATSPCVCDIFMNVDPGATRAPSKTECILRHERVQGGVTPA